MFKGRALVIGGDGLLGAAVVRRLRALGIDVVATTRRADRLATSRPFLDLADPEGLLGLPAAEVVFLCAAQTVMARCEADPIGTRTLNVARIAAIAEHCHAAGAFLVLPSSTAVFDGRRPRCGADEDVSPTTEYGRQKAEIEAHVLTLARSAAVRFSKVLPVWPTWLSHWRDALVERRPVHAFDDMVLAPVPVTLAAEALVSIATARGQGVYQLSADVDITYLSVAQRLADRLSAPRDLVVAATAVAAGIPAAAVPAHTTLDVTRLTHETGILAPQAWRVIEEVSPLHEAHRHPATAGDLRA